MKMRITVNGQTAEVDVQQVPEPPISNEVAMVISSAVASVLEGRPFAIRHIHLAGSAPAWGRVGRQQIHTSHVTR